MSSFLWDTFYTRFTMTRWPPYVVVGRAAAARCGRLSAQQRLQDGGLITHAEYARRARADHDVEVVSQFMLTDLVRGQFFSRSRAFLKAMSSGENATSSSVEPMSIEAPGASEAGSGSPVATSPPDPEQRSAASSGHRLGSDAEPDDQEDTVSKRLTRLQLNSKSGDPEAEVRFLSLAPPIPPPSPPAWRHADQRCVHLRLRHRRPLKSPPS